MSFQVFGRHIIWAYRRSQSFSLLWWARDEGKVYNYNYQAGRIQVSFQYAPRKNGKEMQTVKAPRVIKIKTEVKASDCGYCYSRQIKLW